VAQEIRIVSWCDSCLRNEEHTEGLPVALELAIGGGKAKRLEADLCEVHLKDLRNVWNDLEAVGRRGAGRQVADQAMPCPVDGCERTARNRTGLVQHVIRTHGWTTEQAQAV